MLTIAAKSHSWNSSNSGAYPYDYNPNTNMVRPKESTRACDILYRVNLTVFDRVNVICPKLNHYWLLLLLNLVTFSSPHLSSLSPYFISSLSLLTLCTTT